MDKMSFESVNISAANIDKIAELFPAAITEALDEEKSTPEKKVYKKTVNFEALRSMLGDEVAADEAYEFTWVGKREAIREAGRPIRKTLRPCVEESKNWDTTENIYIEGDNLDALKLLQESYLGKVKMIYIDPPYNTGNDFVYRDNFTQSREEYDEDAGVYDEEDNRLFLNSESNGRFHSDWCSMIYPRLVLARNFLLDDGVIFISIDDNELDNLKKICNEVFGESNYVNTISVNSKVSAGASGGGEDRKLKKNIEYVLIYCKNYSCWKAINPIYKETELMDYIEGMGNNNKSFKYTNVLYKCENLTYHSTAKDGNGDDIIINKVNDYEIKTVKQIALTENISEKEVYYKYFNKIMTTTNAQTSIRERVWNATDNENNLYVATYIPKSGKNKGKSVDLYFMGKQKVLIIWLKDTAVELDGKLYKREKIGTFWDGFSWINVTKEGNLKFDNGKKPIDFIKRMIQLLPDNEKITVLDFFSGSASTAHAVMKLNSEDGGSRKYIMVQYPEIIKPNNKSNKEYLNYLKAEKVLPIITEIGKERIRRAGEKIKEEVGLMAQDLDIGFRVLKLDDTNMKDVYYAAEEYNQDLLAKLESNIKDDRTDMDLLYGCLLDWGLPLSMPHTHEEFDGVTIHNYNNGDLITCFAQKISEKVVKEIAKRQPLRVVFRDTSFSSSPGKINVEEIFKLLAPKTTVKVL